MEEHEERQEHEERHYVILVNLTNETEGHRFADFEEELESWLIGDDGRPDWGEVYRIAQREYGVCRSSVYVDREGHAPARVGWYFESRQTYEDTGERYLRGAWVTVAEVVAPARPRELRPVVLGGAA